MTEDYSQLIERLNQNISAIRKGSPETMQGFSSLARAATANGVLSQKTKELTALAIGVATHCKGCIGFHTKKIAALGVSREELLEVLGVAIYMGGGPSLMYAAEAVQAFDEFSGKMAAP